MKTVEELGISPMPWSLVYDPDNGVPYRIECKRPKGLANRVLDDFDGLLESDAHIIAAAPKLYRALREAIIDKCASCPSFNCGRCHGWRSECHAKRWRRILAEASGEVENV